MIQECFAWFTQTTHNCHYCSCYLLNEVNNYLYLTFYYYTYAGKERKRPSSHESIDPKRRKGMFTARIIDN